MDTARLVLDYIDVLKWPVVVVGLALLLLFVFRRQIPGVVDWLKERTKSVEVGPGGVRWTAQAGQGPVAPDQPLPRQGAAETLPELEQITAERDQRAAESQRWQAEYEGLSAEYQTARLYLYYEQVYRAIFGTQIELLQALASIYPQSGLPPPAIGTTHEPGRTYLTRFYLRFQSLFPGATWNSQEYIAYLLRVQLVKPGDLDAYVITDYGKGFLSYIDALGLSFAALKPY